jgi:hypothetical protein
LILTTFVAFFFFHFFFFFIFFSLFLFPFFFIAPIRLGEPIESLEHGGSGVEAVKAARTRGRYEMVGVGGSLGSLEDGEVAGLTTTTNGDESSGGEEEE